jgi:hypothetical protein
MTVYFRVYDMDENRENCERVSTLDFFPKSNTLDPLVYALKGIVRRKLRWVKSGINQ